MGLVFRFIRQPPVIGEVIGGVLLGPSLLGKISPELQAYLLPPSTAPFLGVIAHLGIILYMFLIGLELDLRLIKKSGHATLAISHASIVVPFISGVLLSLFLFEYAAPEGVAFTSFALFLGVSMSVTAFPVLARILSDQNLQKTPLGMIALTCAAVDDVTAWCLLAFVVSFVQATLIGAVQTIFLTAIFILFMIFVAKPIIQIFLPLVEGFQRVTQAGLTLIFVGVLLAAFITEWIGIHAIFGAFMLGAIIPHDSHIAEDLTDRLRDLVQVLFLPAFFAFTGMRTQIDLVSSSQDWLLVGLIIAVATLGKFGGSLLASRFAGLNWRESTALGILMNTRGLVELIVLNIGLDLGVISQRIFTMLVLMAIVTTLMTSPLLSWVLHLSKRGPASNRP
jgi:Kef-type K+ transport system membrane component KefB